MVFLCAKIYPMVFAVLADDQIKQEILSKGNPGNIEFVWADTLKSLSVIEADLYADLLFEWSAERIERLKKLLPKPVMVNAVAYSTKTIGAAFIRINAWPGFLERSILEIALPKTITGETFAALFSRTAWNYQVTPDIPGMITARIISMIINEAYYALGDKVSTRQEIDIAMKLGTNYPAGPFEWSEKIGLKRVYELLKELSRTDERYNIAPALEAELKQS
jgi:3-hydroxybutyryl-CoA dehydrogenase